MIAVENAPENITETSNRNSALYPNDEILQIKCHGSSKPSRATSSKPHALDRFADALYVSSAVTFREWHKCWGNV